MALAVGLLAGCQQAPADAQLNEQSREEVEAIVREYILENPEIIEEALIELQRRARMAEGFLHGDRAQLCRHL